MRALVVCAALVATACGDGDVALAGTVSGTYASGDLTGAVSINNLSLTGDCAFDWILVLR